MLIIMSIVNMRTAVPPNRQPCNIPMALQAFPIHTCLEPLVQTEKPIKLVTNGAM